MSRRVVEVKIVLLHILAVVAFGIRQAEEPLFEERITMVPKRGREEQNLVAIANPGDAILAPAIGLAACQVVRQVVPGVAGGAIILANRAPRPLADVRPPFSPQR